MSLVQKENEDEEYKAGVKGLADDISDLLAYSNTFETGPFTEEQIIDHFEDDEKYVEEDLEHVEDALEYLQEKDRVKPDFVPGELDEAYSFNEYSI